MWGDVAWDESNTGRQPNIEGGDDMFLILPICTQRK